MALSPVGNAADTPLRAAGTTRRRGPSVPQPAVPQPAVPRPVDGDDRLLAAIRRGLVPRDPVARLLAAWPAAPARPVPTHGLRREPA
jgi:hypothetical protein